RGLVACLRREGHERENGQEKESSASVHMADYGLHQRLTEVGDEIALVLDADGDADERVGEADRGALRGAHADVRHRRGAGDERLDAAEARGVEGDAHAAEELLRRGGASLRLEAEHAAEAVEELAGAGVARMGREARLVGAREGGMA